MVYYGNDRLETLILRAAQNSGGKKSQSKGSNNNKNGGKYKKKQANDDTGKKPYPYWRKKKKNSKISKEKAREKKKEIVVKAAKELRANRPKDDNDDDSLLDIVNPFKAGKKLRKTIESLTGISEEKRSIYLDDRVQGLSTLTERNPMLESGFVPEVLVIGATGEVGRLVVRQLLLNGGFKVRVLVRDLYSRTLNMLGTGVTYCQGDLNNMESLEYAATDVDKIVFCAAAPKPDEDDFAEKFQDFTDQTLGALEQMDSVAQVRAQLAEQVDCVGMQNVVRAYQNVRHADYGTSQTAKRSLFNFKSREEDYNLFMLEENEEDKDEEENDNDEVIESAQPYSKSVPNDYDTPQHERDDDDYYSTLADEYDDEYDDDDEYEDEEYNKASQVRGQQSKIQSGWIKNKYDNAVFVGKVSTASGGGESAIVSSRLRSSEDPQDGLNLSNGFGGFVARICTDGSRYEAFIRTKAYETDGIEYVCEFQTQFKSVQGNKSSNKFSSVRLGFENFRPVQRRNSAEETEVPPFRGQDIRQIGFRYRADANKDKTEPGQYSSFYMAFAYIKVFRSTPEPEFVYLSDARIPRKVSKGMVRHELKQLVHQEGEDGVVTLLDETELKRIADTSDRTVEETYFKYRGEEILKSSGLNYAIVRVADYNELTSGETSAIALESVSQFASF